MKAEWKLRDEQLHCQHGVNEKWRHVERKETLLELGHAINFCRVIFLEFFYKFVTVQNSNNSAEYIQLLSAQLIITY